MVRGEETALFAGSGYIETVMRDTNNACLQSWLHEILLRSRYEIATPNFGQVCCAVNRRDFWDCICVDTYLPRFEALANVVPHFDALTHVVIRGQVFLSSKSVFHLFLDRLLKTLFIFFFVVSAELATVFLTRELLSILRAVCDTRSQMEYWRFSVHFRFVYLFSRSVHFGSFSIYLTIILWNWSQ